MTERDLERLKYLPVPLPSASVKRKAVEAAVHAFDETSEQSDDDSQGNVIRLRQTAQSEPRRSILMRLTDRHNLALAASLAALVIATPIAFRELYSLHQGQHAQVAISIDSNQPAPAKIAPTDTRPLARQAAAPPLSNDSRVGRLLAERPRAAPPGVEREVLEGLTQYDRAVAVTPPLTVDESTHVRTVVVPTDGLAADGLQQPQTAAASLGPAAPPPPSPGQLGYALNKSLAGIPIAGLGVGGEYGTVLPAPPHVSDENRDRFEGKDVNPVKQVAIDPVSTFSIDVDTASYSFVRRALNAGELPPKDAVRVEEMINYFPYAYPPPDTAEVPFKPTLTVMPSPWNPRNQLVHVAIKGYEVKSAERPRANLVFLIDVSGSMQGEDRLPLVKNAFRMLLDQLQPDDTVGIVTYAGESGIALEPTKVNEKSKILSAIDRLGAAGSTAGGAGIQDAYRLAQANFDKAAVNRVILATDGDFNVGVTDIDQLKGLIERKRQTGVFLSILGVGRGNHNDALMQALAQNGNGTAAYVDTLNEARKVLVDESSSTLIPIAKDVKIQVEWNPERVSEYRLIGYETRALSREDFNNDRVDAGDIGSGHAVTAIYEVTPVGAPKLVDDLRYGKKLATASTTPGDADVTKPVQVAATPPKANELGFLKLRYKRPDGDTSKLIELPIADSNAIDAVTVAPEDVRFSVAVAAFGQLLRGAPYTLSYSYDDVLALAQSARGNDTFGYRAEFLNLVRLAKSARP